MGRMNPVPVEATRGSNAAAVAQQHRADRVRENHRRQLEGMRSLDRTVAWVARHPELCHDGQPCLRAVVGAVLLRDRFENPDQFAGLVGAYRRRRIERDVRWGLLTQEEANRMLEEDK